MKKRLEKEKEDLKERYDKQLENINTQIELISIKKKECEDEKKNWTKACCSDCKFHEIAKNHIEYR